MTDRIRVRVLEGHYRDRCESFGDISGGTGTFWPTGTIVELPSAEAQAMLKGGTAELAPLEQRQKSSSPLMRRLRDVFARLWRPAVKS